MPPRRRRSRSRSRSSSRTRNIVKALVGAGLLGGTAYGAHKINKKYGKDLRMLLAYYLVTRADK